MGIKTTNWGKKIAGLFLSSALRVEDDGEICQELAK